MIEVVYKPTGVNICIIVSNIMLFTGGPEGCTIKFMGGSHIEVSDSYEVLKKKILDSYDYMKIEKLVHSGNAGGGGYGI